MKLDSVMQLQALSEMMNVQFESYPVSSIIILGIAGGNGLEHISKSRLDQVHHQMDEQSLEKAMLEIGSKDVPGIFPPNFLISVFSFDRIPFQCYIKK